MSERVRRVHDVAVLAWASDALSAFIADLRGAVDGGARKVLLDMRPFDGLRADAIETLVEAHTVCDDRGCKIGMFGASDMLDRIVEVLELRDDVPARLGETEDEALSALRGEAAAVAAAPPAPAAAPPVFELDFSAATAPTAKFDASQVRAGVEPVAGAGGASPSDQADDDLLAIDWAPLLSTGYTLGGAGAERLQAEAAAGAALAPQAMPPTAPPATTPPRRPAPAPDEIDLGEIAPARISRDRPFKTEVLPAFDLEDAPAAAAAWSPGGAGSVLGGRDGGGDFSPVDAGAVGPPPAALGAPVGRPPALRKSERLGPPVYAAPAGAPHPGAAAALAGQAAGGQAAAMPPTAFADAGSSDGDDQTVMFTPGALDAALLAGVAQQHAAPEPEAAPAPALLASEDDDGLEDETVMFTPDAIDAALLAEVAQAAGPEPELAPPAVEAPPEPAPPPALDGADLELCLFLRDHALRSPLHLQVLERVVAADDAAVGKAELQVATGAPLAQVAAVVDELAQCQLLRRTRSPRLRGGFGFLLAASPADRGVLVRLLKAWGAPQTRARVVGWLESA